ncbi:MAG: hypothetical protein JWN04_6507 [Myxococcaceae bacterium]|nr:hypothetical protein [Myxococcaceae bacterium]
MTPKQGLSFPLYGRPIFHCVLICRAVAVMNVFRHTRARDATLLSLLCAALRLSSACGGNDDPGADAKRGGTIEAGSAASMGD